MASSSRLTALEASFIALERPGLPMHVAGVLVLEPHPSRGPITMPDLRRRVASRLPALPRFRQRVAPGRLGRGPRWVAAGRIDIDAHLIHHRLPRAGGRRDLLHLCAALQAEGLPAGRPLWQMHLIDGSDGLQALVIKTHHSITDGIGGIHIAETLFDRGRPASHPSSLFRHAPANSPAWLQAGQAIAGAVFTAAGGPIAIPSPYNVKVGAERAVGFATIPLATVLSLKRRFGGSVDDVLLGLVAAGLRGLTPRERPGGRPLRAMLPVSTWRPGRDAGTGNHVTAVFVDLPQDTTDLGSLVSRISASKAVLRTAHAAAGMSMLIEAAGLLPAPLHRAAVRASTSLPVANLVVSDVPGSEQPLFMLGRRVAACYPMIPLPASVGLSIAAITMSGVMGIGIVADPKALPRPERLAAAIERAVRTATRTAVRRPPARVRVLRPAA